MLLAGELDSLADKYLKIFLFVIFIKHLHTTHATLSLFLAGYHDSYFLVAHINSSEGVRLDILHELFLIWKHLSDRTFQLVYLLRSFSERGCSINHKLFLCCIRTFTALTFELFAFCRYKMLKSHLWRHICVV